MLNNKNNSSKWRIVRLKNICILNYGDSLAEEKRIEGEIPVYGSNGIVGKHNKAITTAPCIIIGRKGSYGKVNYSTEPCFPIDTTYWIDKHSTNADLRWLSYILPLLELDKNSQDSAVPGLSREVAYEKKLPLPSYPDQKRIAAYLDQQTAKIDRLIDLRRRQIALLKEQRAALIQQAVTRGLNQNLPMKDSGLPWLGEILVHWTVAPVNKRFEVQLGKMLDAARIKGHDLAPYLRNTDVQWDYINVSDLPMMDFDSDDRKKFSLRVGDLLVCEGGQVGRAAIWNEEIPNCYYQKALHRLRPRNNRDNPRFMFYLLFIAAMRGIFSSQSGQTTIDHLPAESLRRYRFPFPPLEEQNQIVKKLDTEGNQFVRLSNAYSRQLTLLAEYRAALIHECVTGRRAVPIPEEDKVPSPKEVTV